MSVREHLFSWWREHRKVARLTLDAEKASTRLGLAYAEAKEKSLRGNEVQEFTAEAWNEYTWSNDALDDALHWRLVQRARRYRVPVPARAKDSQDWEESMAGQWRLTEDAAYKLRKTVTEEAEMLQRPWLNWGSVVVSLLSLVVAILALSLGGGS